MKHSGIAKGRLAAGKLVTVMCLMVLLLDACTPPQEHARRYYDDGMVLLQAGEPIKASLQFQNALQIVGAMHQATFGLALVAEQQSDWPRMFDLLSRVLEQNPKHAQAHLKRGQLLLAANRIEDARSASDAALKLTPESPAARILSAALLLKQGQPEAAVKLAGSVLEQDPGNTEAIIILAQERLGAGRADDALAYVEQGLQRDSSNIGLGLLKIELLEGVGNLRLARESFLSLIQRNPKADKLYPLLARFHMRLGRLADAEGALRTRVNLVPDSSEAKVGLIRFLYAAGRAERAIEELQAFVQEGSQGVELTFLLARLYQEEGSYGKQVIILKTLRAEQTGKPWALHAKAQLAAVDLRQGDTKSASSLVKTILEMEGDNVEGLFLRALIALSERRHEDAIVDLRIIALYAPDLPPVLAALANAHALSGSMQLAQSHYQRAFQASGMDPGYGLAYASFFIHQGAFAKAESVIVQTLQGASGDRAVLGQLAGLRIMRKEWAGAQSAIHSLAQAGATAVSPGLDDYIDAMARSSDGVTDATDVAQSLIGLNDLAMQSGQLAPALDLLEAALASEPDDYRAVLLVGQLRMLQGRVVEAREIFKGMIARDPDGAVAYLNLSRLFLRENRLRDAAHVLAKGLVRRPLDPVLLLAHAEVSERAGNKEEAIRAYEMLIETGHDPEYVSNNLASLLADNRTDPADFKRAYELARGLDHDRNPYFRDTLGWANYRLGRYADAVELLEATIEESPSVAVFHYHLGISYLALDNWALAKQALDTALALGARTPFAEASATKTALRQITALQDAE